MNKRKVLFITVDGVSGTILQTLQPKNLTYLTKNALYCYNGLADNGTTPLTLATAWADQMTGVSVAKHQVTNDDFTGDSLSRYPSFIDLLKSAQPQTKVSAYCSSNSFLQHFGEQADVKQSFSGNDSLVSAAVVNSLKTDSSDVVVAQFHDPDSIGNAYGYDNVTYSNAISNTDNYIGNIMSALQSRPDYQDENWLVVVTSSIGTPQVKSAANPFEDSSRNIFAIFYNSKFSPTFVAKPDVTQLPYASTAPYYTYTTGNNVNATLSNPYAYNFGADGNYTIQFLMKSKYIGATGGWWSTVLSKRPYEGSGNGWIICMVNNGWGFVSSITNQVFTPSGGGAVNVVDGKWHALTTVFSRNSGVITVKLYTDGIFDISSQTNNTNIMDNDSPLKIGRALSSSYANSQVLISNLQIYNTAFSDDDVANTALVTSVDNTSQYYNNLIGYWPCDEGAGSDTLKERTGHLTDSTGLDFALSGPWSWQQFSDLTGYLRVPITPSLFKLVPEGYDIPLQVFQWIGITPQANWELDGTGWSPSYSSLVP